MNKIELLAPAGSMESLIAAINNGADAIYLGGNKFSARAYASNFDNETMMKAVDYAHSYNVKVYVTINTILKQSELKEALKYAGYLYEIGVDAIIIQDLGLVKLIRDVYPDFELHASTQMTIHNAEGALYFREKGMQRIVLSRELTVDEIKYISKDLGIETEIFVHGALCVCYSGQCLMSSMIGGRSGNRGRCAQPCRMQYTLKGENFGERKAYLLSPKDTCFIDDMDAVIKSGTSSLKVEGRMKKPEYVAGVTRNYRKAIDKVLVNTKFDLQRGRQELAQLFNREGFAKAYLYKNVGKDMMSYNYPKNTGVYIGQVSNSGEVKLEASVSLGDGIRFNDDGFTLSKILNNNNEVKEAFKGETVKLFPTGGYKKGYKLYKMSDKKLYDELNDDLKPYKRKINLTGEIEFKVNSPLCIKAKYNKKEYRVYGEMVEEATNKPLTRERVEEALRKSGEIPYRFDKIIFDIFDDGFIRISSINNLRRELFEKILKEEVSSYRRKRTEGIIKEWNAKSQENLGYIYSCITKDQLKALLEDNKAQNIALDIFFSRQKHALNKNDLKNLYETSKDKNIYLKVPNIIKQEFNSIVKIIDELKPYIKGIITSNAGIIKIYKDKLFIIGDYKLNIFNKEAAEFYAQDVDIPFLSLELNRKEIKELMKNTNCNMGINIYGKTELMISEYCPMGSTFGNKSSKKECSGVCMKDNFKLIDRMNESFTVLGDNSCRSYILNSITTNLIDEMEELKSFNISNFRVDFKDESYDEVKDVLNQIARKAKNENNKYTKGHYKRGVE
ncbi:U32 family peptidase [Clostridium beijerinckii]|jgi:Collagenase and related proteases|uniref:U32 family peptidase n=2 Tax=Clostridium beijerinckii TaxID=1520 RepID=A0AAE2V111_CLOBE|nr:U32 family peptidase [Clostridium beijerinckii]ABR33129.1 peptidase U32 [Clostridium beijerinckii NCIMB 8052]AIU03029.1 peptidase U32 [Clostridium beijerinckii ATCC 35702]MBF7807191.1 U32 family peptidase [Clostridium beijerinckii]NOW93058.1 putative protease [Clostridium beijerinckii]NRT25624.1 putative protease [Clostridium beijerinckii]